MTDDKSIDVGDTAPDFELPSTGGTVRLSDLRGKKVVLFFYPKADTPGCTKEACEFGEMVTDFDSRDAAVFGISPDPLSAVEKFRSKFDLPYPLIADEDHVVAEAYGVWKEKSMYGRKFMGVERSTFVIDEQGEIRQALRKVKPGGHAADVLKLV